MIVLAQYKTKEEVLSARDAVKNAKMYSSFSLDESESEHLTFAPTALIGALLGAGGGYFLQYYLSVQDFPLNIGGRPIHSALAFVPATFECAVLGAASAIVLAFFFSLRMPEPHHALFESHRFLLSSESPFFLALEARTEPERLAAHEKLKSTAPLAIEELEGELA